MIKKLQRKFILIAMLAISLVVAILITSVNIANYYNVQRQTDKKFAMLFEYQGSFPSDFEKNPLPFIQKNLSIETPFETRFFSIVVNYDGSIEKINTEKISAVDEEKAKEYLSEVVEKNKSEGYVDYYRYICKDDNNGKSIYVFIDNEKEISSFRRLLVSSLLIASISLAMVFILLVIFSKFAVRPIAESYQKQKEFITNASHDLKTPLTIIDANTEILEMENGENEWSISTHNQIKRLVTLTDKLVLLTRMEEEKSSIYEEFSLSEVLRENLNNYDSLILSKGKSLNTNIENNISLIGRKEEIAQMICLLMDNALKYSVNVIKIDLYRKNNQKILRFYNDVENIKEGNHQKLFDRFYRIDNESRNSEHGGNGIGLSIVKTIVMKHKGKISAKSNDNHSITFTIEFK